jgi:preprotein translocase subunit SecF
MNISRASKVLVVAAYLACSVMFVLLMIDIWEKFRSKTTTSAIRSAKC